MFGAYVVWFWARHQKQYGYVGCIPCYGELRQRIRIALAG